MKFVSEVAELIGGTPLVEIRSLGKGLPAKIVLKLEYSNPGHSIKDRVAAYMIRDAENKGLIGPGSTIVEPTSGNTGIALAMISASRGYKCLLTMPETMSIERRKLLKAYGAQIILTPGSEGMAGAIKAAEKIVASEPGKYFLPMQFENPANPLAHYEGTGPEIWRDTGGEVDFFVAGVGTGGTITGAGHYLKEKKPGIKVIAVEPFGSSVLSGFPKGPHGLQGIGAGFIPPILDTKVYDEIARVKDEEAYETARLATKEEGLLVGISSGASLWAALRIAARMENEGKLIVAIAASYGERYLSTPLFIPEERERDA